MHIPYRSLSPAILVASMWAFSQVSPTSAPISRARCRVFESCSGSNTAGSAPQRRDRLDGGPRRRFPSPLKVRKPQIDTYPGIYFALTQLREHHSFLRIPDDLSDADYIRTRVAMRNILGPWAREVKPPPPSPFRTRSQPEGHLVHSGNRAFAWVSVPECGAKHSNWQDNLADFRTYATTLHSIAAELSAAHPEGWVVRT